jgi:pimeloyl-ACP methyl ester carboxylesterase
MRTLIFLALLLTGCAKSGPVVLIFGPPAWLQSDAKPFADALTNAGYQIIDVDIPCHDDLACWRSSAEKDPAWMSSYIDGLASRIDSLQGPIIAFGVSRGAYVALEAAAKYEKVRYVIGISPLIDLLQLDEFKGFENPKKAATNIYALAPALASKSVLLEIGEDDTRVGTDPAIKLERAIALARPDADTTLIVWPYKGHSPSRETAEAAVRWLSRRALRS